MKPLSEICKSFANFWNFSATQMAAAIAAAPVQKPSRAKWRSDTRLVFRSCNNL
jgi:hypothetical protein